MRSFQEIKKYQPQGGEILESLTGKPVVLTVETRDENGVDKKGIFCRAVASVEKDGWFLSDQGVGLVCFIMPNAQKKLTLNEDKKYVVERLRVVRYTRNGSALLTELP